MTCAASGATIWCDAVPTPIARGRISHTVLEDVFNLGRALLLPINRRAHIATFEAVFAQRLGRRTCIAFPYARTAVHAVLQSLNLPKGSKVLMPPLTIKPILDVVRASGLEPVFCDLDLDTACFDARSLDEALRQRPRVAILTYLFGVAPDASVLIEKLRKGDVFIIEDFSQGLGAESRGRKLGTFGDVGVYSASSVKTLDTYGGGLAVTDDPRLAQILRETQQRLLPPSRRDLSRRILTDLVRNVATSRLSFSVLTYPILRLMRRLGSRRALRFVGSRSTTPIVELPRSWFVSYTSLQARVGVEHLRKLDARNERRRALVQRLEQSVQFASRPIGSMTGNSVYWQYVIYVKDVDSAQQRLLHRGIDTATTSLVLLPRLPSYGIDVACPRAEMIHRQGLYLPCYHQLREREVDRVAGAVRMLVEPLTEART